MLGRGGRRRSATGGLVLAVTAVVMVACVPPVDPLVPLPVGPSVVEPAAPASAGPLRVVGRDLVDAQGRRVLIHGTNMVVKSEPWMPDETVLHDTDLAYLRENGFNAVRLGVWYHQVEPELGVIDTAYLDRLQLVVDRLTGAGLWVLLDFHQDVFWGMPEWATTPAAAALSDEHPSVLDWIGWGAAYTSPRSIQQWRDVIFDAPTAVDPSVTIWDGLAEGAAATARRFASNDRVIGVELLNEPFPGEWYLDCILSGCGWLEDELADRYDAVTAAIRDVAPAMNVWWEPIVSAPGFGPTTMRAPADSNVGFAWHTYCLYTDGGAPTEPSPAETTLCRSLLAGAFDRAASRSAAWDRPMLMTEFGASNSPLNVTATTRAADEHIASWFHWHHQYRGADGTAHDYPSEVRSQLARVYPQATAGTPLALTFDPATGAASYRFAPDASAVGPTSLVVPAVQYPAGYDVTVVGGHVISAPDAGRLDVVADPGVVEVRIAVTRH